MRAVDEGADGWLDEGRSRREQGADELAERECGGVHGDIRIK